MGRAEILVFGRIQSKLPVADLGGLALKPVRTGEGQALLFPARSHETLGSFAGSLAAPRFVEVRSAGGGAELRARLAESDLASGVLTVVRDWLGAIVGAGGGGVLRVWHADGHGLGGLQTLRGKGRAVWVEAGDLDLRLKVAASEEVAAFQQDPPTRGGWCVEP